MKNKICMIIPYFGNFNNYFDLWVESAAHNSKIDFLIFTDNKKLKKLPYNIKWYNVSFKEVYEKIQKNIEFKISLPNPYKLVDYKPVYGLAFKEYVKEYEWWGFGDIDVILGDLSPYIAEKNLKKYDKILDLGHFTLIRNNLENNYLWKKEVENAWSYKYAFKYPYCFHFDEGAGFSRIADKYMLNIYHELPKEMTFADIDPSFNGFRLAYCSELESSYIFSWKAGKLFGYKCDGNKIVAKEFTYIHLQKRNMNINEHEVKKMLDDGFYIFPNKFALLTSFEINSELIDKCSKYENIQHRDVFLKKIKKIISFKYLYNRFFYNLYIKNFMKKNKIPMLANEEYFEYLKYRYNNSDNKRRKNEKNRDSDIL